MSQQFIHLLFVYLCQSSIILCSFDSIQVLEFTDVVVASVQMSLLKLLDQTLKPVGYSQGDEHKSKRTNKQKEAERCS